jgi:CubicO group peptidase (beta-lactamase class C family)
MESAFGVKFRETTGPVLLLIMMFLFTSCISEPDIDVEFQNYNFTEVENVIDRNMGAFRDNVLVLVFRFDAPIFFAERGNITPNTKLPVASATKLVTGAVMLKLYEQGYIGLDDTIGTYLPEFTEYGKGQITIRQLMAHTAGFDQMPGVDDPFMGEGYPSLEASVRDMAEQVPLAYEPGTVFHYGGRSMQIAGRIAEIVTGLDWFLVFREKIGGPCDMISTDFGTSANYRVGGGMRTTVNDFMNFLRMISNNGFCSGQRVCGPRPCTSFSPTKPAGLQLHIHRFRTAPTLPMQVPIPSATVSATGWMW